MANITSHILNSVDGTHAGGIVAELRDCQSQTLLRKSETDAGGRLSLEIPSAQINKGKLYELAIKSSPYWVERDYDANNLIPEIILRFYMPEPDGRYHMPIILSPYGYSMWKSS